jgi:hypothetical protein
VQEALAAAARRFVKDQQARRVISALASASWY